MFTTAEMNAGRKLSARADEPWVEGSDQLVRVDYTYWTLAYILSATGEPLSWVYCKEFSSPYSTYIPVPSAVDPDSLNPDTDPDLSFQINPDPDTAPVPDRIQGF
jgi:hypothetical protein